MPRRGGAVGLAGIVPIDDTKYDVRVKGFSRVSASACKELHQRTQGIPDGTTQEAPADAIKAASVGCHRAATIWLSSLSITMSKEMNGPGCGVTVLGRSGLRYREGARTLFVDGEMLTGEFDFVIYEKSIVAWEGTNESITVEERREIVTKIREAFRANALSLDVE